jgi:hypothetical protein
LWLIFLPITYWRLNPPINDIKFRL